MPPLAMTEAELERLGGIAAAAIAQVTPGL
jgi:hypothetical protein